MAAGITPQSGLLEINGRLKVNEAINPNDVLTRNSLGKKSEKSFFANQAINTISGTTPIVVAIDDTDAYDITTGLPKCKVFDDVTDKIIGIATIDVADQNIGLATTTGLITTNLDSTGRSINDTVYADPSNGQLTFSATDKPIGYLLTIGANAKIYVSLAEASGGSGQLDIDNYIIDGVASTGDILAFVGYDDSAAVPVNGIGGSPTITFTKNTVNALRTGGDWLITKTAANSQGQGIAYEFTIEEADKNKIFDITFNAKTSSAYASGDIGVYIYDVTNSVIINTNNVNIAQGSGKYLGKFFATSGITYRLLFHIQSTNASAYTIQLDNIRVEQEKRVTSFAGSDWIAFPSVAAGTLITATTSNPTYGTVVQNAAYWRRVGDSMEITWNFRQSTAGTAGSGTYLFNLPAGVTIDLSKFAANTTIPISSVGKIYCYASDTTEILVGDIFIYSATQLVSYFNLYSNNSNSNNIATIFSFANPNMTHSIKATVPISGWSSNVNLIQSQTEFAYNTDTTASNNTSSFGYGPEGQLIGGSIGAYSKRVRFRTPIQITDKLEMEVWNGQGWQGLPYTDRASQLVIVTYQNRGVVSPGDPVDIGIGLKIVSSTDVDVLFGSYSYDGSVGSYDTTWAELASANFKWRVRKSAGSAVGEVAPFVGARYTTTTGALLGPAQPATFNVKVYDTHNAVTTGSAWKFTAPIAGYYSVKVSTVFNGNLGGQELYLSKNGVTDSTLQNRGNTVDQVYAMAGTTDVYLNAGDYIDIRMTGLVTTGTVSTQNYVAIAKIG